jgi:hypothetical protein
MQQVNAPIGGAVQPLLAGFSPAQLAEFLNALSPEARRDYIGAQALIEQDAANAADALQAQQEARSFVPEQASLLGELVLGTDFQYPQAAGDLRADGTRVLHAVQRLSVAERAAAVCLRTIATHGRPGEKRFRIAHEPSSARQRGAPAHFARLAPLPAFVTEALELQPLVKRQVSDLYDKAALTLNILSCSMRFLHHHEASLSVLNEESLRNEFQPPNGDETAEAVEARMASYAAKRHQAMQDELLSRNTASSYAMASDLVQQPLLLLTTIIFDIRRAVFSCFFPQYQADVFAELHAEARDISALVACNDARILRPELASVPAFARVAPDLDGVQVLTARDAALMRNARSIGLTPAVVGDAKLVAKYAKEAAKEAATLKLTPQQRFEAAPPPTDPTVAAQQLNAALMTRLTNALTKQNKRNGSKGGKSQAQALSGASSASAAKGGQQRPRSASPGFPKTRGKGKGKARSPSAAKNNADAASNAASAGAAAE